MLLQSKDKTSLNDFFLALLPQNLNTKSEKDKVAKIEQTLAYLEIMHAHLRKYSKKRNLVLIDSGAGNCYLSFLVYYFYAKLDIRPVTIHCLDTNARLMAKACKLAQRLGFDNMHFYACDIAEYVHSGRVDAVYKNMTEYAMHFM